MGDLAREGRSDARGSTMPRRDGGGQRGGERGGWLRPRTCRRRRGLLPRQIGGQGSAGTPYRARRSRVAPPGMTRENRVHLPSRTARPAGRCRGHRYVGIVSPRRRAMSAPYVPTRAASPARYWEGAMSAEAAGWGIGSHSWRWPHRGRHSPAGTTNWVSCARPGPRQSRATGAWCRSAARSTLLEGTELGVRRSSGDHGDIPHAGASREARSAVAGGRARTYRVLRTLLRNACRDRSQIPVGFRISHQRWAASDGPPHHCSQHRADREGVAPLL